VREEHGRGSFIFFAMCLHAGTVAWQATHAKMSVFGKLMISSLLSGIFVRTTGRAIFEGVALVIKM
jgi:hypothetical protein